jgi:hypothetical protein
LRRIIRCIPLPLEERLDSRRGCPSFAPGSACSHAAQSREALVRVRPRPQWPRSGRASRSRSWSPSSTSSRSRCSATSQAAGTSRRQAAGAAPQVAARLHDTKLGRRRPSLGSSSEPGAPPKSTMTVHRTWRATCIRPGAGSRSRRPRERRVLVLDPLDALADAAVRGLPRPVADVRALAHASAEPVGRRQSAHRNSSSAWSFAARRCRPTGSPQRERPRERVFVTSRPKGAGGGRRGPRTPALPPKELRFRLHPSALVR